jgi:hypothetical protein
MFSEIYPHAITLLMMSKLIYVSCLALYLENLLKAIMAGFYVKMSRFKPPHLSGLGPLDYQKKK